MGDEDFQLIRQAILFENEELLGDLLSASPPIVHLRDESGRSPLMLAAHNGKLKALQILVNMAPDSIDYRSPLSGKTALHLSCEAGDINAVSILLKAGADPSVLDTNGYCALEVAHMCTGDNSVLTRMLIDAIQSEESRVDSLHANLLMATANGEIELMNEILAGEKNREKILNGKKGKGALMVACENGRLEGVELLLREPFRSLNVLMEESSGDSILHAAISSQNILLVRFILENYPTLASKCNKEGSSVLHWAVRSQNVDIVELLLDFPYPEYAMIQVDNHSVNYRFAFDLNSGDCECRTALYLAVQQSDVNTLTSLLAMTLPMGGSESSRKCPFLVDVYCMKGRTPLMVAARNNNLQLISVLLSHGADINLPLALLDENETRAVGSGALLEAARGDCIEVAHLLLEKGAVDTSNRALRMAVSRKSESIVLLLLSRLAFPDNEMRVNKRNVEIGQMQIGESLLPSYVCPSKGVILNWSSASLSSLLPQWISAAAMHINTRMRTSTFAFAAITRMDLSNNKLSTFPPLLFQLPSIRSISLAYNEISTVDVPPGYLYSSTIETMILSNNKITSIPSSLLILLPSLTTLDISNNDLSSLPDAIWMCPSLKELNTSGNHLSSLPSAHSSLPSLHRDEGRSAEDASLRSKSRPILRRSHWQKELSLSVVEEEGEGGDGSSHTLHSLDLSHNEFRLFPTSLACICPRLTKLSLAHNLLSSVCSISDLPPSLRSLDVSHNSLTRLFSSSQSHECEGGMTGRAGRRNSPGRQCRSRSKSAVRSQRALSVSRNGDGVGKGECPHRRHSSLLLLKTLNLSSNRLKTILLCRGDIVLSPVLTNLDVSSNEIRELDGVSLSRLTHLSVFSLASNPLNDLPPQLGLLSHLWSLNLKDCPLVDPILSIVSSENAKTVDVISMLRCVLEESKTFPHLKIFILGQSGVGKSTIADAIKSDGHGVKGITQGRCARVFECRSAQKILSSTVTFSVWDCCGEMEVRPLLEYSFCRRALYLVVFRVTEGREAIHSLTSYLLSIHSRAPGASVVLVGTHSDQLGGKSAHSSLLSDLECSIKHRYLSGDGHNHGLPRILDVLFVSLKKKDDIRTVLKCVERGAEGSRMGKEATLSQRIPHSYICLLNALEDMGDEMKKNGKEGIIPQSSLLKTTKGYMKKKLGRSLRDETELSLALSFVRESGLVLRVGESSGNSLVLLDPLSFIDNLSLILSIRSTNRPAGILPLSSFSSLKELSSLGGHLLPLLHKSSLAVCCHSNLFVLPSLLPDEFSLRADGISSLSSPVHMEARIPFSNVLPITKINWSNRNMNLVRLYSMVYVPNGFWPRLISRLTWDENLTKVMGQLVKMEGLKWNLWQTGAELINGKERLVVVKEFFPCADPNEINIELINWRMRVEGKWRDIDISYNQSILLYIPMVEMKEKEEYRLWTTIIALIVDIIDYLLEDWYPTMGTRFVHSSQGDPLVRRLVVCPSCSPFPSSNRRSRDDSDAPSQEKNGEETAGKMKIRSTTLNELSSLHSLHSLPSVSSFSIEECMEAAMVHHRTLECPLHGVIQLSSIAPDVMFLDIHPSLRMDELSIKRGRLIGRGAFGFVFRAHVKTMNSLQPYEVAQKMMEPCDPGSGARVSAVNEYRAVESKWERDSLEYSTRAYLSCRQEVGLLNRLSHPNTLSLMGITCSPLSIVVEMAPLGSLRSLLTSFRKSDAKLSIRTLTESAMQVAKALEYLHSNNIVYRDLKSENVLVWRFPPPFCTGEVEVKVGDYGISRQCLPSGDIKGFGGTEGFMAPEIVKWNGEEEYSLKVDVFSFGMFLYELMTLKQPFENEDHVKEKIVNGGRPLLVPSELLWPCSLLDVLSSCWNSSALSRPSSSQLVSLLCAPELSHLIDTLILPSLPLHIIQRPIAASDDEDDDAHIWIISQSTIDIYSCTMFGWVECTSISMDSSWRKGRLYSRESSDWMWRVGESNELSLLPFNLSHSISVSTPQLDSHPLISTPLAVSSSLFILPSKFSLHLLSRGDDSLSSFNLIESLTSPFQILSFAILNHPSNRQIWTGHEEGIITAHFISSDDKFSFSSSFSHPESLPVGCLLSSKDGSTAWSYLEGSSRIFCWDVSKRTLNSQLDTRKVQPASETIHTLETDCSSRVCSMCVLESGCSPLLFVGTVEGSLLVLSAHSLQPLSACRPYSLHLSTLLVVDCRNEEETQPASASNSWEGGSAIRWMRERVDRLRPSCTPSLGQCNHLLLTCGRGFRSLVDRFVSQEEAKDDIVAALWKIDDWFN